MHSLRSLHYDRCTTAAARLSNVPAPNAERRALLTDTAIDLLAESGVHGLTHRTVERRAGLPDGTASNYFRSREALLVATAEHVRELHRADLVAARTAWSATSITPAAATGSTTTQTIELIVASLIAAASLDRTRYLALFELRMESLRRPALARALDDAGAMSWFAAGHHPGSGLDIPPNRIPLLSTLYSGVLFSLVTDPTGDIDPDRVRALVTVVVNGALRPSRNA